MKTNSLPITLFAISLFVFSFVTIEAQTNYSEYEKMLQSGGVSDKLTALDSLIKISRYNKDYDGFIQFTEQYLELALAHEKYDVAAKRAMALTYPLTVEESRAEEALELIDKVLVYEDKLSTTSLGGLYIKRGGAHFEIAMDLAIQDYSKALEILEVKDTALRADAHQFRAQAYSNKGDFVKSIKDYGMAYALYESINDVVNMTYSRGGEIIVYSQNGILDKAIEEREQLIEKLLKIGDIKVLSGNYYNQSLDYKKSNNDSLREKALLDALKYADNFYDPPLIKTVSHAALSEIYLKRNELEKSEKQLQKATEFLQMKPNDNFARMEYLGPLIRKQIYTKNFDEAEKNALEKLRLVKELGYSSELPQIHLFLSEIYEGKNNIDKYIYHNKTHNRIKDSIHDQNSIKTMLFYQALYETERKEKELVERAADIALLKEKNTGLRRQYILGGSLLTLGFLLLFFYKEKKNLQNKKNLQEKYTQDLLLAQEEERKRMSKDLHDGLGQSLLLIKNKVILNKDESTQYLIDNAIEEVRSIARALHPYQLQELGITQAIKNALLQLDESTDMFISSDIEDIDSLFSSDKEINIYRIVQESLNNIIKHAQASSLRVTVKKTEQIVEIMLKDNGVGFDFSEKYNDFKSLGLKTLKERTRFLNGIMKVHSVYNEGTTLEFIIPLLHETV